MYAKNDRKNFVSNYKISIILKMRSFLAQLKYKSLYNDRVRHIYEKMTKKVGVKLQIYYKPKIKRFYRSIFLGPILF